MGMKEELRRITEEVRKVQFEVENAEIIREMYNTAREGSNEVVVYTRDLKSSFKDYIFDSGFYIRGLKPGTVDTFENLYTRFDLKGYEMIKIKW